MKDTTPGGRTITTDVLLMKDRRRTYDAIRAYELSKNYGPYQKEAIQLLAAGYDRHATDDAEALMDNEMHFVATRFADGSILVLIWTQAAGDKAASGKAFGAGPFTAPELTLIVTSSSQEEITEVFEFFREGVPWKSLSQTRETALMIWDGARMDSRYGAYPDHLIVTDEQGALDMAKATSAREPSAPKVSDDVSDSELTRLLDGFAAAIKDPEKVETFFNMLDEAARADNDEYEDKF